MAKKYTPKTKRGSSAYEPYIEDDLSLEDILAEYGGSRAQRLVTKVEEEASTLQEATLQLTPPDTTPFSPPEPPQLDMVATVDEHTFGAPPEPPPRLNLAPVDEFGDAPEDEVELAPEPERPAQKPNRVVQFPTPPIPTPAPPPPVTTKAVPMESVMRATIDAVLEDQHTEPILPVRKRGLFSRKLQEETEEFYESMPEGATRVVREVPPEPAVEERDCGECAVFWRRRLIASARVLPWAVLVGLVLPVVMGLDAYGIEIPYWTDPTIALYATSAWLVLVTLLCGAVFSHAAYQLCRKRITMETLLAVSALAGIADCVLALVYPEQRGDAPLYTVVCGVSLVIGLWGVKLQRQGEYEMFRVASLDDTPPHLVTDSADGACKQKGTIQGFYTLTTHDDISTLAQAVILPVVLMGGLVFAVLCSFGREDPWAFPMALSAILGGGGCAALALSWGLPWATLASHLRKYNCTVASYQGAKRISQRRTMIVTDDDLFPSGTLQFNGYKLFGEELSRAASYAASIVRVADSGLFQVFDQLRRSESAALVEVQNFQFRKEGGYSATISGETVLLGTANFMNKLDVRLPTGLSLRTGIFLAVDGQLTAVFAVKYLPSEHVDYALRIMRRHRVLPVLAVRDPNITAGLLHRKFGNRMKMSVPTLAARIALSETSQDCGTPHALLLRGGLLPYAKAVVGSRRMCSVVHQATVLGLLGSLSGVVLSFYLVFLQAFTLLTPLSLLAFTLAWSVPVVLGGLSVKHL